MKAIDQAKKIYDYCTFSAENNRMITYRDVLFNLGYGSKVGGRAIKYGLELVWIACASRGLPSVTAIVVNKYTQKPSAGYSVDDWQKEAKMVFEVRNWPKSKEIDWGYIWDNRKILSNKYGTTGYW